MPPAPIQSRENPLARQLRQLSDSAHQRRRQQKTVLDGIHLVQAYCATGAHPESIIVSESGLRHPEIQQWLQAGRHPQPICFSDRLFAACSPVQAPMGIAALITYPALPLPRAPWGPCLMLEGIQDPGNLGTLLRSAAASGMRRIFLSPTCASAWSPRVCRAAMGAHFQLEIFEGADLVSLARHHEGPVLAAALTQAQPYHTQNLTGNLALLIGNEGSGLSDTLLEQARQRVYIPMQGAMESLNAAVAGSILLFERQRQQTLAQGPLSIGAAPDRTDAGS